MEYYSGYHKEAISLRPKMLQEQENPKLTDTLLTFITVGIL
jgi:hypothetical protein